MSDYVTLDLKNDKEVLGSFVALLGVALAHRNGGAHNQMHAQILSALIANDKLEAFGLVRDRALYGIQVWDHGLVWTDTTKEFRALRIQYLHGENTTQDHLEFLQWGIANMKGRNPQHRIMVMGETGDQLEQILPKCGMEIKTKLYEC